MFNPGTIAYLRDLAENNERQWFEANRERYERDFRSAAEAFASVLEGLLERRYGAQADSKVWRVHRDVRFSRDKTPYNPHIHIGFKDRATGASWLFGLQTASLVLGYGEFAFSPERLDRWRRSCAADGMRLAEILDRLKAEGIRVDAPELKRVPPPYDGNHEAGELLRRKGLVVWRDEPQELALGEDAPAAVLDRLAATDPVRDWFIEHMV